MSVEDNMAKVTAGFEAVNARDIETFLSLLEPDFQLNAIVKPEILHTEGMMKGKEGFRNYLNMLYTAFPDFLMEQIALRGYGNMVYQEIVMHGTHGGPLELPNGATIPASGITVVIVVEVYHTFDQQGRFISSTGYANLLDVARQFGLK